MSTRLRAACWLTWTSCIAAGCASAAHGMTSPGPQSAPGAATQEAPLTNALLTNATVIELSALRTDPARYEWFQFKPGIKKLILSGKPESRHVAVLWYGYEGAPGMVPLHYHAKTESIYVIDGAQSDPKGMYPKGSFYFNPPGSGHSVFDSSGLFLLSYAAPADFTRVADIGPYENVVVDPDYDKLQLSSCADGSMCRPLALASDGGMTGRFVTPRMSGAALAANVLLLLRGTCVVEGQPLSSDTLVVTKSSDPATYAVTSPSEDCLLFQMAFE